MDAYQYFFDGDGEQTGYQQIGEFEFDDKPSHQHWHFRDFASYTLLRADKTTAAVSKKEAFCLANTDSIDQTVANADWNPENTDLSTDCGQPGSLSLREVLAAGWGDTYAQFRAGQSFNLKDLPNGTYYIATIANPNHRLVESNTADNVALRKIYICGKAGARKVERPQDRSDRGARPAVVRLVSRLAALAPRHRHRWLRCEERQRRASKPPSPRSELGQPLRSVIFSVAAGRTVLRSPTTPKSTSSKIGASSSLLTATMVFEVCMPARCWMAPEMPAAM